MDSVNNCVAQSNNSVNFQSLKKINLKGYKNCPDKAKKILDEFVKMQEDSVETLKTYL